MHIFYEYFRIFTKAQLGARHFIVFILNLMSVTSRRERGALHPLWALKQVVHILYCFSPQNQIVFLGKYKIRKIGENVKLQLNSYHFKAERGCNVPPCSCAGIEKNCKILWKVLTFS